MATVSVVMPVYNGVRFIGEAISSVLQQSFADWELIIVDDGSTDDTIQVVHSFPDPRIRLISQPNAGEAHARNTGLRGARGEYIAFLDSDDRYMPNALVDLVEFLEQSPEYGVVYSDGYITDEAGRALVRLTEIRPQIFTGNVLEHVVLSPDVVTYPVCTLTRRRAINDAGACFDTNLVIGADWDFWIQLARSTSFGYLDQLTCAYRVHTTNITRTTGQQKRRRDLIAGRMKVMAAPWFDDLPCITRQRFLYHLLVELGSGMRDTQDLILQHPAFRRLRSQDQAVLLRQVAIDSLQHGNDRRRTLVLVHGSLQIGPRDWKSWLLRLGLHLGWPVALSVARLWRFVHRQVTRVRTSGHRQPKRPPASLAPSGDH